MNFQPPRFEHIEGAHIETSVSGGITKDNTQADSYDFTPLSGDHVVSYTPDDEEEDKPAVGAVPEKTCPDTQESSPVHKNITVSVYSPEQTGVPSPQEDESVKKAARKDPRTTDVSKHITNTLAKRKADSAALAAGLAAGALAAIGGLAKLLSKRRRR